MAGLLSNRPTSAEPLLGQGASSSPWGLLRFRDPALEEALAREQERQKLAAEMSHRPGPQAPTMPPALAEALEQWLRGVEAVKFGATLPQLQAAQMGAAAGDYVASREWAPEHPRTAGALAAAADVGMAALLDPANFAGGAGVPAAALKAGLPAAAGAGALAYQMGRRVDPSTLPATARTVGRSQLGAVGSSRFPLPPGILPKAAALTPEDLVRAGHPVSTRFPTAKRAAEDPITQHDLLISPSMIRDNPDMAARVAPLLEGRSGLKTRAKTPRGLIDAMLDHQAENLIWLHDQVPLAIRARSKLWYVGANKIARDAADLHGIPLEASAAIYAALSPQKDWFQNAALGNRLIDIVMRESSGQGRGWSREMDRAANVISERGSPTMQAGIAGVRGKRYRDLDNDIDRAIWVRMFDEGHNPREYRIVTPEGKFGEIARNQGGDPSKIAWGSTNEIAKALSVINDPSPENISRVLGQQHKVRSFYNNIANPMSRRGEATIDTHAVAADQLLPIGGKAPEVLQNFGGGVPTTQAGFEPWMGAPANSAFTGVQGTYGLHLGGLQSAAAERGILPREMQSITWEAVRNMFTNKSAPMHVQARAIWDNYRRGRITRNQVQEQLLDLAGGIDTPTWAR